jgi:trigger factor
LIQVTETNADGLRHDFKVVVSNGILQERVDARLDELARSVTLPGFRPGKVPVTVLRKRYGGSVMGEVIQETVNEGTQQALAEKGLRPALQPKIEITKFEDGGDLEYTLSIETLPTIDTSDFSGIELQRMKATPADVEVDKQIERLAEAQTAYTTEEGRAAESGDAVVIDFVGSIDGKEFDGGTAKEYQLVIGSGSFVPGFEEQLVGVKAGEHRDVSVAFPDDYPSAELAGKQAVFAVEAREVKKPEKAAVDDELAKKMGLDDLAALRKAISDQMSSDNDRMSRERLKRQLLDALADRFDFAIPVGLVDSEFEAIWKQFGEEIANTSAEKDAAKSEDELRAEYRTIAERRVRLGLLLSDVGERNNIEVRQEELNRAMAQQARRFPGQERKVIEYYQNDPQAMAQLRAPLYEDKVVDFILEMVTVTDREVPVDELLRDPDDENATDAGAGEKSEKPKARRTRKAKAKNESGAEEDESKTGG